MQVCTCLDAVCTLPTYGQQTTLLKHPSGLISSAVRFEDLAASGDGHEAGQLQPSSLCLSAFCCGSFDDPPSLSPQPTTSRQPGNALAGPSPLTNSSAAVGEVWGSSDMDTAGSLPSNDSSFTAGGGALGQSAAGFDADNVWGSKNQQQSSGELEAGSSRENATSGEEPQQGASNNVPKHLAQALLLVGPQPQMRLELHLQMARPH